MSTIESKSLPSKKVLNSKLLPIAAILLVVLGLLFMATPLLRASGSLGGGGNFIRQGNGQNVTPNGQPGQGNAPQFFIGPGAGGQGLNGTNNSVRRIQLGGGILSGVIGSIFYFVLLLVSLAAALGMFFTKRWGQVLGIIMAAFYALLGLISLLPLLFASFIGIRNPLSLILGGLHLLLAIAILVLASIPARIVQAPAAAVVPPGSSD